MIRLLIGTIFIFCGTFTLADAQGSSEFHIRLFGAEDTEAPASTTISSAVPVSASQIDLEWATSTDNYTVFGYVVFRDGSAIATTTSLSYSDTGLTASTSYSYTIFAFDGVPNYSSSSDAVATTTPEIPIVATSTPTTTSNSATRVKIALDELEIEVGAATASVAVQTNRPARIEIRIGETTTYELGYIVGNIFASSHTVPINDLRPDTKYYYEIVAYTPWGTQTTLRTGSFTTLSDAAPTAPTNVRGFTATPAGQSVELQWQMPADLPRDAIVRVVRSHYGYPLFINDGVVVYEGSAEAAQDAGVLGNYDRVYYTAFVIDPNGRISSGALAQVSVVGASAPGSTGGELGQTETEVDGGSEQVEEPDPDPIPFNPDMPVKDAIVVTQADLAYTFASSSIPLSGAEVFTVSVPATAIIGDFKTIIATLSDPRGSGKTFSFLLRLNADRTSYEATIAPVRVNGMSDLTVEVYDYDALVMARYTTQIEFSGVKMYEISFVETWGQQLSSWLWASLLAVPFIVLFALWFIFWRRAQEEQLE